MSSEEQPKRLDSDRVRKIADNAWFLLITRAAAGLAVPAFMAAFAYVWNDNANKAVMRADIERLEERTSANAIALSRAASREDIARMEERIIEQINQLREDQRADRRAPQ